MVVRVGRFRFPVGKLNMEKPLSIILPEEH